jgi:peptide/nickel transport system permease protein
MEITRLKPGAIVRQSQSRWLIQRMMSSRKVLLGVSILLTFFALALIAPLVAPGNPAAFDVDLPHLPPSPHHWFGTGAQGQDIFAQTLWGSRVSLAIGVTVGVLATALGTMVGVTAAYFGRWVDDVLSVVINVFLILPGIPLLLALAAFLPRGSVTIVFVLAFTGWAWTARVIRAQAMSIRQKDFVSAALVSGESSLRIMLGEIVPNMASIVAGALFGSIIYGIGAQAALEFLGLGDISSVSWGTNLYWATNNAGLVTGDWWTFVPSGLCIAMVASAFALMNFAMDEITNPRLHLEKAIRRNFPRQAIRPGHATLVVKRHG